MKGIVLHQPWAVAMLPNAEDPVPVKRYETRGHPFGGLGPAGVRALPGCKIEPGERVAILAGASRKAWRDLWADQSPLVTWADDEDEVAWGAVIGTARFTKAIPMGGPSSFCHPLTSHGELLVIREWPGRPGMEARTLLHVSDAGTEDVSRQLPWGDYRAGRWAMEAVDAVRLDCPVPIRGLQGVHHLRDTTAGAPECPRCSEPMLTTSHHDEHDWCPSCGWVDE